MSSYDSKFDPLFGIWEVRVDLGVENGTNRNVIPTFLCDSIHTKGILHRLATLHNAADTHRAMVIGRLCYSIGGLISKFA